MRLAPSIKATTSILFNLAELPSDEVSVKIKETFDRYGVEGCREREIQSETDGITRTDTGNLVHNNFGRCKIGIYSISWYTEYKIC